MAAHWNYIWSFGAKKQYLGICSFQKIPMCIWILKSDYRFLY